MIGWAVAVVLYSAPPDAAERARTAYDEDRFEDAARTFAEAYAQTQDIAYLFAEGRSWRLAGDCEAAIARFEAFLAAHPEPEGDAAARDELEQCGVSPAEAPAASPVPEPASAPVNDPPAPPTAEADPSTDRAASDAASASPQIAPDARRTWPRDPLGGVLAGLGVAAVASGATLAIVARSAQQRAERAPDVTRFGEHNDRAVAMSTASVPVMIVGGALLAGAVLRYTLLARRQRATAARPQLWSVRF